MPELEREGRLLVREPELLRPRPHARHLGGGHAGPHERDRAVEQVAAAAVGVDLGPRGAAHRERAVVAGAVAHVAVEDVEVGRVAGTQDAVRVDVRVRVRALAGDRVHALDVLRAQVVEHLGDQADALVLAHPRPHAAVELVVGGVHHHARGVEQGRPRRPS